MRLLHSNATGCLRHLAAVCGWSWGVVMGVVRSGKWWIGVQHSCWQSFVFSPDSCDAVGGVGGVGNVV